MVIVSSLILSLSLILDLFLLVFSFFQNLQISPFNLQACFFSIKLIYFKKVTDIKILDISLTFLLTPRPHNLDIYIEDYL